MAPNHLLQLVTLTAMEPPISFDADAVRDEQTKILHAIQRPSTAEAALRSVRGQYDAGEIDGHQVPAYRSEPNVAPDSNTETYGRRSRRHRTGSVPSAARLRRLKGVESTAIRFPLIAANRTSRLIRIRKLSSRRSVRCDKREPDG